MKHYKIILAHLGLVALGLGSCELTKGLDEFEQIDALNAESAVSDEASAELALAGMYSVFLVSNTAEITAAPELYVNLGVMGVEYDLNPFGPAVDPEALAFAANDADPLGRRNLGIYTNLYQGVNRANWIIFGVETNSTEADFPTPGRRDEVLAEAYLMRAYSHFQLLRTYGEWYDLSSPYGIDLQTEPTTSVNARPRASVQDCWDLIMDDLAFAAANAPEFREAKFYFNSFFARGLQAKCHLYMGEYAEAAAVAGDLIADADASAMYGLEATYSDLYNTPDLASLSKNESLFNIWSDFAGEFRAIFMDLPTGGFFYAGFSSYLADLATNGTVTIDGQVIDYDNDRYTSSVAGGFFPTPLPANGKYPALFPPGQFQTLYIMRLAEVYLIQAEALARATGSTVPSAALQALNTIRERAGATSTGADGFETYPASISYDEFLEAVRTEKLLELFGEAGEPYYDLVRYDYLDGFGTGFQASDLKPTMTDPDKFIWPLPATSIDVSNGVIEQNPGY